MPSTSCDGDMIRARLSPETATFHTNLISNQIEKTLASSLQEATRRRQGSFVYISGHAIGGVGKSEAIVGNNGDFLFEERFRRIFNMNFYHHSAENERDTNAIVIILDMCHAAGLMNLPHAFVYKKGNRTRTQQRSDGIRHSDSEAIKDNIPCFCLTAVMEDQEAQLDDHSSLFTRLFLASSNSPLSLDVVMGKVSRECDELMKSEGLSPINPVVSFNDAFVSYIQRKSGLSKLTADSLPRKICLIGNI